MVSPEILKRNPFFAPFSEQHLVELSMIADQIEIPKGTVIFEECGPADTLYILLNGGVELFFKTEEQHPVKVRKEFAAGDINPGEILAISALIEPYVLNASARATQDSTMLKIDATALRDLFEQDCSLGFLAMKQISKSLMERLAFTRVQLAAAWA